MRVRPPAPASVRRPTCPQCWRTAAEASQSIHPATERVEVKVHTRIYTVCPGSSDPPEKYYNKFASEN